MFDCANVEMRELLPELVAGTLDAPARARVEAHVVGCAECASELDTLRLVRASFANAPALDTARIVRSLPKPPVQAPQRAPAASRPTRWMDWRVAAALTMITVGGLSIAVTQRTPTGPRVPGIDSPSVARVDSAVPRPTTEPNGVTKGPDSGSSSRPKGGTPAITPQLAQAELKFGGGSDGELDDAALRALLGALDEIDRGPVAPSAEPDGSPVLPVIRDSSR